MSPIMKMSLIDKIKFLLSIKGKTFNGKMNVCKSIFGYIIHKPYVSFFSTTVYIGNSLYYCRGGTNDLNHVLFHEEQFKHLFNTPNGVFVDIGAHIGKHSIYSAVNRATVIAIEPSDYNFQALKRNIQINELSNIYPYNAACWDKDEEIEMYHDSNGNNSVMDKISESCTKVSGVKLDTIINNLSLKKIDIIKIDVERAETKVLEGATETLKQFHPKIVFEAFTQEHLNEIMKILKTFGYSITQISSCDYLAVRGELK